MPAKRMLSKWRLETIQNVQMSTELAHADGRVSQPLYNWIHVSWCPWLVVLGQQLIAPRHHSLSDTAAAYAAAASGSGAAVVGCRGGRAGVCVAAADKEHDLRLHPLLHMRGTTLDSNSEGLIVYKGKRSVDELGCWRQYSSRVARRWHHDKGHTLCFHACGISFTS